MCDWFSLSPYVLDYLLSSSGEEVLCNPGAPGHWPPSAGRQVRRSSLFRHYSRWHGRMWQTRGVRCCVYVVQMMDFCDSLQKTPDFRAEVRLPSPCPPVVACSPPRYSVSWRDLTLAFDTCPPDSSRVTIPQLHNRERSYIP